MTWPTEQPAVNLVRFDREEHVRQVNEGAWELHMLVRTLPRDGIPRDPDIIKKSGKTTGGWLQTLPEAMRTHLDVVMTARAACQLRQCLLEYTWACLLLSRIAGHYEERRELVAAEAWANETLAVMRIVCKDLKRIATDPDRELAPDDLHRMSRAFDDLLNKLKHAE